MKIKDIFVKDLSRKINGVVKAEQREPSVIWQELDEFVVTKELLTHIDKFFQTYLEFLDSPNDIAAGSRNGVWISGFFGSGKSHLLKILSYLLSNIEAINPVDSKTRIAVDFLKDKISDPLLFNNIKRAVNFSCDVILFNIDSKADVYEDSQAQLLSVFTKVFNELQGFCGQYPYVANLEYELQKEGLLEAFVKDFEDSTGISWLEARDSFHFRRDEIVESLKNVKNMSHDSAALWFDGAEQAYTNSPELFCKRVKQYIQTKPQNHRIIFMVDEMGQFIGSDGQQMLKLQTIVEDLGIHCGGQAWVVVTSQEDMDATIGGMKAKDKKDFSKIQGRFKCRLSLSSANTDEVIQSRLLEKTPSARVNLTGVYERSKDFLNHKLSFTSDCSTLNRFTGYDDFIKNYPFAPFQYQIIQKVFETVRTSGMAGAHLSRGERSMLDSFQMAALKVSDEETGALVPLHSFYSAIEGFLDTSVKKTVTQAADNPSLKPFDIDVLKTLFLIRRIDNMVKPNVDNLVTLHITDVDSDRLGIKNSLNAALDRLEKETLINRNGDHYFFLTTEERDIGNQIKNTEVTIQEERSFLAQLIYEEALKTTPKHRYSVNKKDYGYKKLLDGAPFALKTDGELTVEIISPLSDDYSVSEVHFLNRSLDEKGKAVFRLGERHDFMQELRTFKQTDKFIALKYDSSGSPSFKKILEERGFENKHRKSRLLRMVKELFVESDCWICGDTRELKSSSPDKYLAEALDYLINAAYPNLGYIKKSYEDHVKEIKLILSSDHPTQQRLIANLEKENPDAIHEVQTYIRIAFANDKRIELNDVIKYFSSRPFGWSEWDIVVLIARLFVAREIKLIMSGEALGLQDAIAPLTKTPQWKQISIQRIKTPDKELLEKAKKNGQVLFGKLGPDDSEGLQEFLKEYLNEWKSSFSRFKIITETGTYPGKKEINEGLPLLIKLLNIDDPFEFFSAFNAAEDDLSPVEEDFRDLSDFYQNQTELWNRLRKKVVDYQQIQSELENRLAPERPVRELIDIVNMPRPYSRLKSVQSLLDAVDVAYKQILDEKKHQALSTAKAHVLAVNEALKEVPADDTLSNKALKPLKAIERLIENETRVPQFAYHVEQLESEFEKSLELIEKSKATNGVTEPEKLELLKISDIAGPSIFKTEEQVNEFVEKLREKLLNKIKQSIKIKIH